MQNKIEIIIRCSLNDGGTCKTEFISDMHDVPTAGRLINRFYPLDVLMKEETVQGHENSQIIFPEAG